MSITSCRYDNFIEFLEHFEEITRDEVLYGHTSKIMFSDIINYIITKRCNPSFNIYIPREAIYRQCVDKSKCINGILLMKNQKVAVCIRYSPMIEEPLFDIDVKLCLELCKEQNITNVLIITNKIKIDHIIKEEFEKAGLSYCEFIRKDFSNITRSHICNILRLTSLKSLMTNDAKVQCVVL